MPPEERPAADPALEEAPFQRFSLRTLFWITTQFACMAAVVGFMFRGADEDVRAALFLFWGVFLLLVPLAHLHQAWLRRRVLRKLQRRAFSLPNQPPEKLDPQDEPKKAYLKKALGVAALCVFAWGMSYTIVGFEGYSRTFYSIYLATLVAWPLSGTFWGTRLATNYAVLGENGLVLGLTFIPWSKVARLNPDPNKPNQRTIILKRWRFLLWASNTRTFFTPEDQIPEVDAFIAERLAQAHGGDPE